GAGRVDLLLPEGEMARRRAESPPPPVPESNTPWEEIFRANVVDSTLESFVFEMTGTPEKIDAFADLMRPLGLVEIARTGVAGLKRGA
ncbi:MAG: hypothetical protein V4630_20365, partial [Pseudomonadota bacterium]